MHLKAQSFFVAFHTVKLTKGGDQVRIQVSNAFGDELMKITSASIGINDSSTPGAVMTEHTQDTDFFWKQ